MKNCISKIFHKAKLKEYEKKGFRSVAEEWWHFTLENEPYPDTYFDFPVDM